MTERVIAKFCGMGGMARPQPPTTEIKKARREVREQYDRYVSRFVTLEDRGAEGDRYFSRAVTAQA